MKNKKENKLSTLQNNILFFIFFFLDPSYF
jgi:hypothetical protein